MKNLLAEIIRVYKKAPLKITGIWFLDIFEAVINVSNPYIIGNCIDGLLRKEICWFIILLITEVAFWFSRTINKYFDTRLYVQIIEDEENDYYSKMVEMGADSSLIAARLELVDRIPNFLEVDFFQILNMVGGIIVSLYFLLVHSTWLVFFIAITISAFIPFITYRFQKDIVRNNKESKNLDEERMKKIVSRDQLIYKQYLKSVLKTEIVDSDLDTKIFVLTYCFQMLLLLVSIITITYSANSTAGMLFSTVTYVGMLNEHVSEINNNIILLRDLKDDISRLKEEKYNGL